MSRHPAAMALPFTAIRELVDTARSRAMAAEQSGDKQHAFANQFLADTLTETMMAHRKTMGSKMAELRRAQVTESVQDRAAARVLLQQAKDFEQHAADLASDSFEQMDAGHLLAARESLAASEVAQQRAQRTRHALGILLDHTGLDMADL